MRFLSTFVKVNGVNEIKLFLLIPVMMAVCGCAKEVEEPILLKPPGCDSAMFSYSANIRPVITANCSGPSCHSGGNDNFDYRTYEVLTNQVRTGVFEERLLLPVGDPLHMPRGRTLGTCDLFTLRVWIQ